MTNMVRILSRTDPGRALDLARKIGRRWNRVVGFCEVAEALAAHDVAAATAVMHEALAEARADDRDDYRAWLLRHVVWTLRLVEIDAAHALARELPDASQRARALMAVAGALVRHEPERATEALEETLSAAREVTDEWARWLESDLVAGWAEVDVIRALAVAREIGSPDARIAALATLLPILAEHDPCLACEIGEKMLVDGRKQVDLWQRDEHKTWYDQAFLVLAKLSPERFLGLVAQAEDVDARRLLMYQFVRHVALLNRDRAKSLGEGLARAEERSWVLGAVNDALGETDLMRARQIAEQMPGEDDRRRALIDIVQKMTESDPHGALQCLAELQDPIVALDTVQGIADALAESDPQTAVSLAWQLLEAHEHTYRRRGSTREALESDRWTVLWTLTKASPAEALKLARRMRSRPLRVRMMLHVAEHLLGIEGWSEEDFTEQEPLL
jgi:hypothetical protein